MGKSKIFKSAVQHVVYSNSLILILFAILIQSCSKTDGFEQLTYSGRVLVYNGPEIDNYETIDDAYLEPLADVQVFISFCKPWSGATGGGCTPKGRLEETGTTDAAGEFSISFRADINFSYYPDIEYRSDYVDKSGGYSNTTYKDIILVPRSLIK